MRDQKGVPMFIQTEATPNPATLKFLPGRDVVPGEPRDFPDSSKAGDSPLAMALFAVEGIEGVFFGADFITITKDNREWQHLKPAIMGAIMEHFMSGAPVMSDGASDSAAEDDTFFEEEDRELVGTIRELIDTRVRPAVAMDGGDIIFKGFKEGTVYLHMQGACAGCPSSTATLKHGIENLLRHFVPAVEQVEQI